VPRDPAGLASRRKFALNPVSVSDWLSVAIWSRFRWLRSLVMLTALSSSANAVSLGVCMAPNEWRFNCAPPNSVLGHFGGGLFSIFVIVRVL